MHRLMVVYVPHPRYVLTVPPQIVPSTPENRGEACNIAAGGETTVGAHVKETGTVRT